MERKAGAVGKDEMREGRTTMKTVSRLVLLLVVISCNHAADNEQNKPLDISTAHFRIHFTAGDASSSDQLKSVLEDNYARICADLNVDTLPVITITFHASGSAFRSATGFSNLPSWVVGIATSSTQVHVVSPASPDANRPFEEMMKVFVHEFTHCVTLHVNGTFANNPRWLWEAVSLYEAGQFSHPSALSGWEDNNLPTLASLDANWQTNVDVYTAGYVMVEYILQTWDKQHLVSLILSNGNIEATFGVPVPAFEQGWWKFLRDRYG